MTALEKHPLPIPRGRLRQNVSLAKRCWFGVGGAAEWLFTPEDEVDLAEFLAALPNTIPVTVLGVGSNLLVRDGGIEGVVIRLGRGFANINCDNTHIIAGAGALDVNVAQVAANAGISGLEFLVGIPGTIGGAARMNAGAYTSDLSQIAHTLHAVDRQGNIHNISAEDAGFTYRHSIIPADWIVTRVEMEGITDTPQACQERMQDISDSREATQPVRSKTGGSTFKNPEGHKAWQLIDAAGCRGLRNNDAQVSELHCNFLINHGNASADDLESLGETVRERVFAHSGVMLEWEIKRIGRK